MPTTHTGSTRRLIYQHRHHRGPTQRTHYMIACPTCGHRALLGLTYSTQPDGQPATATVLRFKCTNQMAPTHQSPTNAQLLYRQ